MKPSVLVVIVGTLIVGISIPTFVGYARMGALPPTNMIMLALGSLYCAVAGAVAASKS